MRRRCCPRAWRRPERFYLQEYENEALAVTDLTAELLAAIEAGALIVNYSGHGSVNIWATEQIIDNRGGAYRSDVATLTNSGMYPFVVNMSCLTGYFIYPQTGGYAADSWRSLAEGWMWPANAGAVAALMPTAMTDTDGQQILSNALYEGIFALDKRSAGAGGGLRQAAVAGQRGCGLRGDQQHLHVLRGPGDDLKVPLPRRPQALTAVRQADGTVALSWAAALDCDGNAVAGYNLYRRLSTEESYTKLNTALITGLTHTDTGLAAAAAGATYYYALSAVDSSSDESVKSARRRCRHLSGAVRFFIRWRRGRRRVLYRCGRLGALAGSAHAAGGHGAADLPGLDRPAKKRVKGAPPGGALRSGAWRP